MPHPRRFIQARLVDYRADPPALLPEPRSRFLYDPRASAEDPVHAIEASSVSELGVRLESSYVLARGSDGRPHLWLQRRRLVRPRNTSRGLAFDVLTPELPAPGADAVPGLVTLEITAVTTTPLPAGLVGAALALELRHGGAAPLGPLVLLVEHGQSPRWSPASQNPLRFERLLPGEPLSLTVEVLVADPVATTDVRVTLRDPGRPGATLAWATHPCAPPPPEVAAGLAVEAAGAVLLDGAVASAPLQVSIAPPEVPAAAVELELRGERDDWTRLASWRAGAPVPHEGGWTAPARATWNVTRHPGAVWVRVRMHVGGDAPPRVGAAVSLAAPAGGTAASARLGMSFELRDVRGAASGARALGVVILENAGTEDVTDAALAFEQRQPAGMSWEPIGHAQESSPVTVPRGERVAVPVLLSLAPAPRPLLVRARVDSPRWALSETGVAVW